MKARVKSTGEIVDVAMSFDPQLQDFIYEESSNTSSSRTFGAYDLESIPEPPTKEIDWEQRRYELAKEVLPRLIDRIKPGPSAAAVKFSCSDAAKTAIDYADALIEELKK